VVAARHEPGDRFPDLVVAGRDQLQPERYDGEIVVWRDGRLNRDGLLQRSGSPARVGGAGAAGAGVVLAFDLLALAGRDLRPPPWTERHALLEISSA
jgi:ATP-dependent DNA ligase